MFSLASFSRSCRHGTRSIVCLSLCALLPVPPQTTSHRLVASRQADDRGPGWYESSWELVRGLDIAEVPDLEAELSLWIEACLHMSSAPDTAFQPQPSHGLHQVGQRGC